MPYISEEEYQSKCNALGEYAKLREHIFALYQRLFPTYQWVDPTAAGCVMHGEIELLRERERPTMGSMARPEPKVIQICASVLRQDPMAESFRVLTNEGQIWEQVYSDLCGVGSWKRVELPWETPAVQNVDEGVGE